MNWRAAPYSHRWLKPAELAFLKGASVEAVVDVPGAPPSAEVRMRADWPGRDGAWVPAEREGDVFRMQFAVEAEGPLQLHVEVAGEGVKPIRLERGVVIDRTPPVNNVTVPSSKEMECTEPTLGIQGRMSDAHPVVLEIAGEAVAVEGNGAFLLVVTV